MLDCDLSRQNVADGLASADRHDAALWRPSSGHHPAIDISLSTLAVSWFNVVGQVDAVSAALLRHVSRVVVINCLEGPWRLIRQALLLPIAVPLMAAP